MTTGLAFLPINDIPFEEQRPYPGYIQCNCKQIHRGQFHSADTVKPARRTPDDPVDLLHPAELPDRAAEFQVLTERDELKPACLKKNIPLYKNTKIPKKSAGIFCTRINKKSDDRVKETRFPKTVGERSPTDTLPCASLSNNLQGISRDPAVNVKKEQDLSLCRCRTGVHLAAPSCRCRKKVQRCGEG
jgi:hypothetical protein